MKKLKFIVAVAGFTIATLSSMTIHAKKQVDGGGCENTTDTCGFTSGGNVICGTYKG